MTTWPNWVDIIIVTVTLRMCYSGYVRGIITELLLLFGAVVVTVLSISYWGAVAAAVQPWVGFSPRAVSIVIFWVLFLSLWFAIRVVRRSLTELMKWERLHWFVQGIGLLLGGLRGLWWSGFLVMVFTMSGFVYLQQSVEERSLFGARLLAISRSCIERLAEQLPGGASRSSTLIPSVIVPKS